MMCKLKHNNLNWSPNLYEIVPISVCKIYFFQLFSMTLTRATLRNG